MSMIGTYARGLILAVMFFLLITSGAWSAAKEETDQAGKAPQQAEASYDDPLGRSTPQGTIVGFLKAIEREDYERAVDYLDTRQTGKNARQLSLELQRVLDERVSVAETKLSTKPEGDLEDGLPVQRELVAVVKTKSGEHKILLERVRKGDNPEVWLFSAETLKLIPHIYEEIDSPWFEGRLPAALTENRLAGLPLYRWIMPLLMLPVAILFGWITTVLFYALLQKSLRHRLDESGLITLRRIRKPLVFLFSAGMIYLLSLGGFTLLDRLFWTFLSSTMAVAGLTWICFHLIEVGAEIMERRRPEGADAVIRLSATLLKALVVMTGLVVIFHYFAGINLTAVVAGLGIGGIAVAFAAQKTIENFFGGVFLVWDKPIRLGDFCKAGEYQGIVEHIGLRSTQIRTSNRTVAFIPNGQLASIPVENFTLRDRFLLRHTLNLRYETTADQLRFILAELRELLYRHSRVDSMTVRVRLIGFGQSSLDVEIFAYVLEAAYEQFLAVQEDLLLRIMDLVESAGSGFAFPSQTLYMSRDEGLDEGKGHEAAEAAQRWRARGELPFPDHAPERISQLEGTLDYPPKGSVLSEKKEGD
ncbi:MscS family membrane protein [Syntrophus gentianae]|uniref:MscS family membrane protein n=1 Tax=Syntrophus gentianae TaxID=43775 RepID=A0A1H7Y7C0_9BACT|nr:mechanosensitive ion channel family protein [Syntrophus gentianae]SEM41883.1 MscS family membrane protein [Syntrophus gentianae]